ncbi:MAG: hypothetical protein J3K34DRAFT_44594 [Monoraphidium minutum]|nr:MAG: hypothetical protein J3K34DRAFT_44594 [Monoraphidium minutum]
MGDHTRATSLVDDVTIPLLDQTYEAQGFPGECNQSTGRLRGARPGRLGLVVRALAARCDVARCCARAALRPSPPLPCRAGDPTILPAQFSRFWYNITPWTYRVSRRQFQWFSQRKAAQRRKQHLRRRSASAELRGASPLALPVLPPTHPFIVAWSTAMLLLDLTYTAILLPLAFAFGLNARPGWLAGSLGLGFLFTLDMGVMLHRAVVLRYMDRTLYVDGFKDVAWVYALHGHFWIDLPVALSVPVQVVGELLEAVGVISNSELGIMQVLVLVRGLRLVRLLVLQRQLFFGRPAVRHALREVSYYFLSLLYVLVVLLNWLACMMLAIAHHEHPTSVTWLASVKGQDLTNAPPLRQYIAAIYFVVVTACTVGYGDISGGTALEQLAVVLTVIVGVTFIAFSVKSMVDALLEAALQDEGAQRIALLRTRARTLCTWARWQSTSRDVMDELLAFYQGPGLDHAMVDTTWGRLLVDLPAQLRGELMFQVFFRHHPEVTPLGVQLLDGVEKGDALHVLAQLEVAPLCTGHTLCWEGDGADSIWLLQEGSLTGLRGVLPRGPTVRGPALVAPFDLAAWLQHQREQELAGTPPHAHTHPHHGLRLLRRRGGAAAAAAAERQQQEEGAAAFPAPCYTHGLQAVDNCFLYRMSLKHLALVVRCLPVVRENLLAAVAPAAAAGCPQYVAAAPRAGNGAEAAGP